MPYCEKNRIHGEKERKAMLGNDQPGAGIDPLAALVAKVLDFEHDEALTLGRAVAGLNAYFKGIVLGLFQQTFRAIREQRQKLRKEETVTVDLLHHAVPARYADEGILCENLCEKNLPKCVKKC